MKRFSSCIRDTLLAGLTLGALLSLPARAADQYWDVNGNTAGLGGSGAWNLTNLLWNSSSTGTGGTVTAWNNGALDNAIFGGTAGTVTLTGPITAHNLSFQTSGYTITGNTLTLGGVNPQISYSGAAQATINSGLTGSNGLTVNGGSTSGWVMLGGNNTLTGGINVNSGARLIASGSNSLNGAGNVVTVNNGGVLQLHHSNAFGGNTSAANLVINNGGNLWLVNQNLIHNITATGGTVTIADVAGSGNSTWTGNLALTADTTLLVNNTGNGDNLFFAGNLTDTGANRLGLEMNEGGAINSSLWLSGTNSFTGGITVNAGQLFLSGNDSAAAAAGNIVTINGGILRAESSNAFGGDTAASRLILNDGGRFRVGNNVNLTHDVRLTGGTAYLDGVGNATWNGVAVLTADTLLTFGLGDGHAITVTGDLSDNGAVLSLRTVGSTMRFSGDLSFSGGLTLAAGNTWFDGGNYTYSGDTVIESNARLLLNSTSLSPNSNIRFEGLDTHTTIIYGTNAMPDITMANGLGGGELRWNGSGGFYALDNQSDVTVNLGGAGATLVWNDGLFVPDGHALILGTNATGGAARQVDFQNGIDLSGGLRQIRADNGSINDHAVMSGMLTGGGGLHVTGNGLLELTNAGNDYSGATVVGDAATNGVGNLLLGAGGALSPNSNLQINGVGTTHLVQHGGYILLNAASGDFTRNLGIGADEVQWTASGGFGAIGAPQTVNIGGSGATLMWGSGGFVPTGHALRFGGNYANSTINWQNGIDLGAADRTINVNEGSGNGFSNATELEVNLNGVIEGSGGLVLKGAGDIGLNALNTYSGATYIGGSEVGGINDSMWIWANTLADAGSASSLGAGANVMFASHGGGLIYTGGATSTNRDLALHETDGGIQHLHNRGSGALSWTGDVTTTGVGTNTLRLGGTFVSSDLNGDGVADNPNIISGVISDGTGITQIQGMGGNCVAGNVWRLSGANTFTGAVNPLGCIFEATTLANAGDASSVGAGDLLADHRSGDGTLRYIGSGDTSDRSFWAWANSRLESSGTGPLTLTSTDIVVSQNGGFTHWLGGTNTGDNTLAATLVDGPTPVEFVNSWFRLAKEGPGLWALVTDNNAQANAYSGMTRIFGGALRLDHAGAITGGLGVTSSHGTTGSSQRSSVIRFEVNPDGSGGVLGLTDASGGFFRGLTTIAGESIQSTNGTTIGTDPDGAGPLPAYGINALDDDRYVQGVRWFGSGGFAAWDGMQTVNLFGDGREVTWNSGGFVPAGHQLIFGYATADGTIDFRNGINLGNAARTVHVNDGLAGRDAILGGVLRSTGTSGGLTKNGAGALTLTANNTYTGNTTINAGTLEVGNGGTAGSLGSGAQAVVAAGATLVANRSNAYTLSQNVNGDGTLVQRGGGTTTMTTNSNIDHVVLEHGTLVTPGTLLADDITFSDDGGAALRVAGTLRTGAATATSVTGGALNDTVRVTAAGNMLANGTLGDGDDTLDVAGTLNTAGGTFDLADGDDTLVIHDNTNVIGTVTGGAGIDTLNTDIATTASLDVVQTFETLTKTGAGTLNVDGPGTSDFSTVNVNAGTLQVVAGADISAAVGGTLAATVANGATLDVDGAFGCGAGNDSLTIAGRVTGTGTIDQCGGDDLLRLRDGANVSGYTGVLDGGAHTVGVGDTVELDIATSLNFGQGTVTNYENLLKSNIGTATLGGAHSYSTATISGGTLDVNGSLTAPTVDFTNAAGTAALNVDGTVQAAGATQVVITGSAGGNTVSVGAGGTLLANGDLGAGDDVLDVAGTLDTGGATFMLGDDDDMLVIHDNTALTGTVDGGTGFDSLNANFAGTADLGAVSTFEELIKSGAGTLNINGPAPSDFVSVDVQAGTLNIGPAGSMNNVRNAAVANGAALIIDGSLLFTTGADVFTVGGTVSGLSTIDMLDGADNLVIQDGADLDGLAGPIDGGAGADTLTADIAGSATLGGAVGFEILTKTNAGVLHIDGSAPSDFDTVIVNGGTLDIGIGGDVSDAVSTTVAAGAALNVDGSYAGSAGDDTMNISGAVTGSGTVVLGNGDDTLTLNDGADMSDLLNPVDGGAHGDGDTVAFNNAGALSFDGSKIVNFEFLRKDNTGEATLAGNQAFSGGAALNGGTLTLTGDIETPAVDMADDTALNVDGSLQAGGGTATAITGSTGVNTVNVGGTLLAAGDLGDGADTLDVSGTLDTGSGTFFLGDGDDDFIVHDGTVVTGTVDGGAGFDTRSYEINTSADVGALVNFEGVTKTGTGTLNIIGPGTTELGAVDVLGGTLNIGPAGDVVALAGGILDTFIGAGATLHVDGSYGCGAGNDTLNVSGTVSGGGTIDLCGGEDTLTLNDGASLTSTVNGGTHGSGDTVVINNAAAASFDAANTINFEILTKQNAGNATLIGSQSWSEVNIAGGILTVGGVLEAPVVTMSDDTTLAVDGALQDSGAGNAAITGSAGVNTVTVAAGAVLLVTGDLGNGGDILDVAGTLDTGGGVFALGGGNDRFVVYDTTAMTGTVEGGAGTDLLEVNVGTGNRVPLGSMLDFESLGKSGGGTLQINGSSGFIDVNINDGTLEIGAGGVTAQNTIVSGSATLNLNGGNYSGTAGADIFQAAGAITGSGSIDLGNGNDSLDFAGTADLGGLGAVLLDGGLGTDTVNMNGLSFEAGGGGLQLDNWENINLLNGSRMSQGGDLVLGNSGILYIDAGSVWSPGNHMLSGNVDNAGRIEVGGNAATIDGDYRSIGDAGVVAIDVAPSSGTAGVLQIGGDVQGNSSIDFNGDGSRLSSAEDILVVFSPNDNLGTAGSFRASDQGTDNLVRLSGTLSPFLFGQHADNNWYLTPTNVENLPELPGYSGGGTLGVMTAGYLQKTAEDRGNQLRECFIHEQSLSRREAAGHCSRSWVLLPRNHIDIEGNPGFAMDGDLNSLYLGTDNLEMTGDGSAFMVGAYLLYQQGEFNAGEGNLTGQPATLDTSTRAGGLYGGMLWPGGTYLDISGSLVAMDSRVRTQDGFDQSLYGTMLNLAARFGHPFQLSSHWRAEPHLGLSVTNQQWDRIVDAFDRRIDLNPDTWTAAQAGARLTRQSGGGWRFWLSLLATKTLNGGETQLTLSNDNDSQTFQGHRFDSNGKAAIGVSGAFTERIEISSEASATRSIDGTEYEESEIYLGMRIVW